MAQYFGQAANAQALHRPGCLSAAVVGSRALLREGIVHILGAAGFRIVASASHVDKAVISLLPHGQSVLLVLDANDGCTVEHEIEMFAEHHPAGRIVVLADSYEHDNVVSAFRKGVNAYLVGVATTEIFIKVLELVMLGETILPPEFLTFNHDRQDPATRDSEMGKNVLSESDDQDIPPLSPREQDILTCIAAGHPNKVIAHKVDITEATVKVHVKAILRKIHAHNRTQAAIWAIYNGFVSTPQVEDGVLAAIDPVPIAGAAETAYT